MAIDEGLRVTLEALPVHSPQHYSRISLDPRLASEFLQFSDVSSEERTALAQHIITAKWSPPERAVYKAVVEGFTTEEELQTVTGMAPTKVHSTIGKLEKKGVLRRIASGF